MNCLVSKMVSLAVTFAGLAQAADVDSTLTAGATNTLRLQKAISSSDIFRVYESSGVQIGDQINLQYSSDFELSSVSTPTGWAFQNIDLNASEKVATFYFVGTDPGNGAEFVDLGSPIDLQFQIRKLSENSTGTVSINLEAQLTAFLVAEQQLATAFCQDTLSAQLLSGTLATFRQTESLPADGTQDTADQSGNGVSNLLYYAFGLGSTTLVEVDRTRLVSVTESGSNTNIRYTRRIDQIADGIQYVPEYSDDMATWNPISGLTPGSTVTPVDSDFEQVTLTVPTSGTQRFYRLAVSVE